MLRGFQIPFLCLPLYSSRCSHAGIFLSCHTLVNRDCPSYCYKDLPLAGLDLTRDRSALIKCPASAVPGRGPSAGPFGGGWTAGLRVSALGRLEGTLAMRRRCTRPPSTYPPSSTHSLSFMRKM
ncbi:hypothetical protein BKA61DRAFT_599972 [Leptodontidium sp. MPI-SDFR-AT-0119]|nr:hypothetical protein BKA61DRAFT_599972 [Leptodontidium sp. MPI-SDFR-AT-0119]